MKKFLALLIAGAIAVFGAVPCYAAETTLEKTTVHQLKNGITVEETIIESDVSTLATNQKRGTKKRTYRNGSDVIAVVTLTATFWYDGSASGVISSDSSHTTYSGWSYGGESMWEDGDTVYLNADLSHSNYSDVPVGLSLTCSPDGQTS